MNALQEVGKLNIWTQKLTNWLFQPVFIYSLVAFRILFGLIMLWEVYRYFSHNWIYEYWIAPSFHFTYEGFHWVKPWLGDGMYYHFYGLGLLAIFITIGFAYRISTLLFFLGFTYTFLLEQARYLNHFYLVILISFLLIFLPCNRCFSVDAKLFPRLRKKMVPRWTILVLQIQLGLVYFFGGIAKLNPDWLRGEPLRMWLADKTDFPIIGKWFTEELMVYFFSYSGLLIDLFALPLLFYQRTRPWIFLILLLFHLTNDRLFSIGIFPWFAIGATTIFFSPNWPLQIFKCLKQRTALMVVSITFMALVSHYFHNTFEIAPILVGATVGALLVASWSPVFVKRQSKSTSNSHNINNRGLVTLGLMMWLLVQCIIPLRHFFIPGNVSWTEEGHRFSWHMKLRSKQGHVDVVMIDQRSQKSTIVPITNYLKRWQYSKMCDHPYMIRQFTKFLSIKFPEQKIIAIAECSLNGRESQLFFSSDLDISNTEYSVWRHNEWIYPLQRVANRNQYHSIRY